MRSRVFSFSLLAAISTCGVSSTAVQDVAHGRRVLRGFLAYNGGLSKGELRCSVDTQKLYVNNPELEQVVSGIGDSIDVQEEDLVIELKLKGEYVSNLTAACTKAYGMFLPMEDEDFICVYQGLEVEVLVINFAQCLAETPECENEDPVKLLEEVWDAMDLECREKGEPAPPQTQKPDYSSSSSTSQEQQKASFFRHAAGILSAVFVAGGFMFLLVQRHTFESSGTMPYPTYEMSHQDDTKMT
jgi:hypothetical protein